MSDALREAVRGLHVADPDLGFKPLLAKLREQQPDLGAVSKEVRQALTALKESEAKAAAAALVQAVTSTALTAADGDEDEARKECGRAFNLKAFFFRAESAPAKAAAAPRRPLPPPAPLPVALSLACIGCARLPSDMEDEREKHPICDMCRDEKLPTTYQCGVNCPAGPGAWKLHGAFHKKLRKGRKAFPLSWENDILVQQAHRELAEKLARNAAQTGDKYDELLAEGVRYASKKDWRRSARACREAIALRPDGPAAHYHLACVLSNSGHHVEAVQRHLEAKERYPVGSEGWAVATANSFDKLLDEECSEVAKPEWWNDKALKVLSAIVVRAAPDNTTALRMRATVLAQQAFPGYSHGYSPNGKSPWVAGPRSAAELREAAVYWDRAAALMDTTSMKDKLASLADGCRSMAQLSAKLAKQSAAIAAKEASIEAAKKAEAEKRAEKDRKTAERLEQFRNVRIGEAITSGK